MKLLSEDNPKIQKLAEESGYYTVILHLAPADLSGHEVCGGRSAGCTYGCLNLSGMGAVYPSIQEARIRKTRWLFSDREGFKAQLVKDVEECVRRATRRNLKLAVRLNGTSDLPWLAMWLCDLYPDVQFYDYTKLARPWLRIRKNYDITFSLHEENLELALEALEHGINVAVVFDTGKGQPLPETWQGYRVIDGDLHDMRFLDPKGGVIVGLRAKGKAKKDEFGFVQIALVTR